MTKDFHFHRVHSHCQTMKIATHMFWCLEQLSTASFYQIHEPRVRVGPKDYTNSTCHDTDIILQIHEEEHKTQQQYHKNIKSGEDIRHINASIMTSELTSILRTNSTISCTIHGTVRKPTTFIEVDLQGLQPAHEKISTGPNIITGAPKSYSAKLT